MLGCNSGNFDTTRSGANRIQGAASGGTGTWSLYQSPDGHDYYHNELLGKSVWAADFAQCESEQAEVSFRDTGSRTYSEETQNSSALENGVDNFSNQISSDENYETDDEKLLEPDGHNRNHSSCHMMPMVIKVAKKHLNSKSKRSNSQKFSYGSKVRNVRSKSDVRFLKM